MKKCLPVLSLILALLVCFTACSDETPSTAPIDPSPNIPSSPADPSSAPADSVDSSASEEPADPDTSGISKGEDTDGEHFGSLHPFD